MMLYLSGAPAFTIMQLGRWLSDPFIDYIEQQVLHPSERGQAQNASFEHLFNFPMTSERQLTLTGLFASVYNILYPT